MLKKNVAFATILLLTAAGLLSPASRAGATPEYQAVLLPANIAPTTATSAPEKVEVSGSPRQTRGHPCTLWDREDIDRLKAALTTDTLLQNRLALLKRDMDRRITQPTGIPEPGKNQPGREEYRVHGANSTDISNLGILYALTGEEKYGDFGKKMLVAYARGYPTYRHPEGWTSKKYRSAQDGRLTGQFLDDGFWLARVAFGYDLVYNLPAWTPEERRLVRDDLLEAIAREFYDPVLSPNATYVNGLHNRSVLCMSATLMAGYASENEKLVTIALYGQGGSPENLKGGLMGTHLGPECILPDGLWLEGAPGYQVGIAACGMFNAAETAWHHGIDLYRFNHGALKRFLDSALGLAYPDAKMSVPALHDSAPMALLDDRDWFSNEAGVPYQCGYRRYRDPRYLPIIRNANQKISMTIHAGPPSLFLELPPETATPPRLIENANYYSVGYGVLRFNTPAGGSQLILEYGPNAGHAHPSKLGIDFYALGEPLRPFPGVIFPYNDPMDPKWYWTTLANCALTMDEKPQIYSGNHWKFPRGTPPPAAIQLVYGPAATVGIQRAWSNTIYTGVIQDRALFLTTRYLADLFAATGDAPHKYDLAWHFRGKLTASLKMQPHAFPEPVADGYNGLTEVTRAATTDQAWSATIATPAGKTVRFLAAGGTATEVFGGNGHFFIKGVKNDEFPPTLIQRRANQKSVLYGNVTDVSGDPVGYIKGVVQEGGIGAGYGLLKVETVKGTDLCFAAYRPGDYQAAGLETDAQQAFVSRAGPEIQSLYLGGGKRLKAGAAAITRSEPGLAYVEKLDSGAYVVGNPSPAAATVTVILPALDRLEAYVLDAQNRRAERAEVGRDAQTHTVTLRLKADAKIEFAAK